MDQRLDSYEVPLICAPGIPQFVCPTLLVVGHITLFVKTPLSYQPDEIVYRGRHRSSVRTAHPTESERQRRQDRVERRHPQETRQPLTDLVAMRQSTVGC